MFNNQLSFQEVFTNEKMLELSKISTSIKPEKQDIATIKKFKTTE